MREGKRARTGAHTVPTGPRPRLSRSDPFGRPRLLRPRSLPRPQEAPAWPQKIGSKTLTREALREREGIGRSRLSIKVVGGARACAARQPPAWLVPGARRSRVSLACSALYLAAAGVTMGAKAASSLTPRSDLIPPLLRNCASDPGDVNQSPYQLVPRRGEMAAALHLGQKVCRGLVQGAPGRVRIAELYNARRRASTET
ncbi:uncharacterized protein ACOB8E_017836 [Sarcophilus harrisii]